MLSNVYKFFKKKLHNKSLRNIYSSVEARGNFILTLSSLVLLNTFRVRGLCGFKPVGCQGFEAPYPIPDKLEYGCI